MMPAGPQKDDSYIALQEKIWMQNHVISYNIQNKGMVTKLLFVYVRNQCIKVHTEDDVSSYLLCVVTYPIYLVDLMT